MKIINKLKTKVLGDNKDNRVAFCLALGTGIGAIAGYVFKGIGLELGVIGGLLIGWGLGWKISNKHKN